MSLELSGLSRWDSQHRIGQLEGMLERGYGRTNKPLSQKRVREMEATLQVLKAEMEKRQERTPYDAGR